MDGAHVEATTSTPPIMRAFTATTTTTTQLHSFDNAERAAEAVSGWSVVKGYAIFELLSAGEPEAYIALRHWWNVKPNGSWVASP